MASANDPFPHALLVLSDVSCGGTTTMLFGIFSCHVASNPWPFVDMNSDESLTTIGYEHSLKHMLCNAGAGATQRLQRNSASSKLVCRADVRA